MQKAGPSRPRLSGHAQSTPETERKAYIVQMHKTKTHCIY
jgi:hypothetical protein